MAGKEVAVPAQSEYPITQPASDIAEVMSENVGHSLNTFDLDRVKIPTGGGRSWEIPTLEGAPEAASAIEGIIVAWKDPRAYWSAPFGSTGANNPPDCSSTDGSVGVGDPGGPCATCQYAQFGTAVNEKGEPGRGQACKQMRSLLIVRPGQLLPVAIFLPPTSLKPIKNYFLRLASQGLRYSDVVTKLVLEKDKNAGGIDFSFAVPSMTRMLEPNERAAVREYSAAIKSVLETVELTAADVQGAAGGLDDGQ